MVPTALGLMAAMYRIVVQGWSKEDALNEMTQGGFGDSGHFKDGVRYMMQADVDKLLPLWPMAIAAPAHLPPAR